MGDQENARILYARPTIFVDAARANDTGDGLTWATAKKTINGAKVVAAASHCILIGPGTYTEQVDLGSLDDLLVRGASGAHLTYANAAATYTLKLGSRTTVEGLRISLTQASGNQSYAVCAQEESDVELRDCRIDSVEAGVGFYDCALTRLERCTIQGVAYGVYAFNLASCPFEAAQQTCTVRDCRIIVSGTGTWGSDGILLGSVAGIVRGTQVYVKSTTALFANALGIGAYLAGGSTAQTPRTTVIDGCTVTVYSTTAPYVGAIYASAVGVVVSRTAIHTATGGNPAYDLYATGGGEITCEGCALDEAKTSGTVTYLRPAGAGVAEINVDSTGGELTLAKALEVIVARCVGDLTYSSETGVATFKGRDAQTPVATVQLTGGGNRTGSSIPD